MTLRCRLGLHAWIWRAHTLSERPRITLPVLECSRCGVHRRPARS
jgi:hypothetical protein